MKILLAICWKNYPLWNRREKRKISNSMLDLKRKKLGKKYCKNISRIVGGVSAVLEKYLKS